MLYYGDKIPLLKEEQAQTPFIIGMVVLAVAGILLGMKLLKRKDSE